MKYKTFGAVIVLTILAMAASANAETSLVLNTNSIEMCPCATTRVIGTIESPLSGKYTMTSDSSWATIAPQKLALAADERGSAYIYITPDCNTPPGTYPMKINADSETGSSSALANVAVLECHGTALASEISRKSACIGDIATFDINIKNTGKTSETFKLSSDYGTIAPQDVSLDSGASTMAKLSVIPGSPLQKVTVTATSATSYAKNTIALEALGENCYSSDLSIAPEKQTVCQGLPATYTLTLKNMGTRNDAYTLSGNSLQLGAGKISINSSASQTFALELPTENKSIGEHKFNIVMESSTRPGSIISKEASLTVENCYSLSISAKNNKRTVCPGIPAEYELTVKNTGKLGDNYTIDAKGGVLSRTSFSLDAGEARNVSAIFGTNISETKERQMAVNAYSNKSNASIALNLGLDDFKKCYNFEISTEPKAISLKNATRGLFTISIKNTGKESLEFALKFDGPQWAYLDPATLKIAPGKTGEAYVYVAPTYGAEIREYPIKVWATDDGKASGTAQITVALGNATAPLPPGKATAYSTKKIFYAIAIGVVAIAAIIFLPGIFSRKKKEEKTPEPKDEIRTEVEPEITAVLDAVKEEAPEDAGEKAAASKKKRAKKVGLKDIEQTVEPDITAVLREVKKRGRPAKKKKSEESEGSSEGEEA